MNIQTAQFNGFLTIIALLILPVLTASPAKAQIIYDNGTGTTGYGYYADASNTASGDDTAAGDVFTATQTGTVNAVDFSGIFYSGTESTGDTFALNLYAASNTTGPGTPIAIDSFSSYMETAIGTHVTGGGMHLTVYQFSGLLATPFDLTKNDTYYFSISDLTSAQDDFAVVISDSIPAGGSTSEYSASTTPGVYDTSTDALAFQLKDQPVPEPSEWALLLVGLLSLMMVARFRRRLS